MKRSEFKQVLIRLKPYNEYPLGATGDSLVELAYDTAAHCFINGIDNRDSKALRVQILALEIGGSFLFNEEEPGTV